ATHGEPSENNAHPHICNNKVVIVHNGIIENYETLREQQLKDGYLFTSDTDTEVVAHQFEKYMSQGHSPFDALLKTTNDIEGAYALGVINTDKPDELIATRSGSPLVIGLGEEANYIASDMSALLPVTKSFIILNEGDIAVIKSDSVKIFDHQGAEVTRKIHKSEINEGCIDKGHFDHFMLKEIYEQPSVVLDTLADKFIDDKINVDSFGENASEILRNTKSIQIVACGTSYHAGLIAKYGIESLTGISCNVEVASEFRYRKHVVQPDSLFITLSQSGETADTLAALRIAKDLGFSHTLTICNVPESSMVRESELSILTQAGPEIGVASTKAFTTQLVVLLLLITALARNHGMAQDDEQKVIKQLQNLPRILEDMLNLDTQIRLIAKDFKDKTHALFLGRGMHYPVALEGALKLKEISYIHAEGYPAGELKHGPLALVDENIPIIAVAPNDELIDKLKANLQEVSARGGKLYVFTDKLANVKTDKNTKVIEVAPVDKAISPIIYTIPLQLLAYHVAVLKGTDVDQPRNLAKSVTVE
ncbi:MAG: glutamine--fructose-6-phosphate transaminase (isomerizing), partial [Thioalkalispiraceae bacterium]